MNQDSLVQKHKQLTKEVEKLDLWIDELQSGRIVDLELSLSDLFDELDLKTNDFTVDDFQVSQKHFLSQAFLERGIKTRELDQIVKHLQTNNPIIQQYGISAYKGLQGVFEGFGLYSIVYDIPQREWYHQVIKPIQIDWTKPLSHTTPIADVMGERYRIHCGLVSFGRGKIELWVDYIQEIDSLFWWKH